MDTYEEESNSEDFAEFQSIFEQDCKFMDNVIDKVSQLKMLEEEVERKRRELDTNHIQNLEQCLTQVQEQMSFLQPSQIRSDQFCLQPTLTEVVKTNQIDTPPYEEDILKWKEFWDMFEASVHKEKRYATI